jgi:hypothetical protein
MPNLSPFPPLMLNVSTFILLCQNLSPFAPLISLFSIYANFSLSFPNFYPFFIFSQLMPRSSRYIKLCQTSPKNSLLMPPFYLYVPLLPIYPLLLRFYQNSQLFFKFFPLMPKLYTSFQFCQIYPLLPPLCYPYPLMSHFTPFSNFAPLMPNVFIFATPLPKLLFSSHYATSFRFCPRYAPKNCFYQTYAEVIPFSPTTCPSFSTLP